MRTLVLVIVCVVFSGCISFWAGVNTDMASVLVGDGNVEDGQEFGGFGTPPPGEKIYAVHHRSKGIDLGGVHYQVGLSIHWAGSDPVDERVRPIDVIQATIERLQAEQITDLGSDANARALIKMLEAKAELTGDVQETPDGPVIR